MIKDNIIITSIFGGKDNLQDPPNVFNNCDYIVFSDMKINQDVKIWKQYSGLQFSHLDNYQSRRNAKLHKVLNMITDYKYVIWVDATHNLNVNPNLIYDEYGNFDYLVFKHSQRRCIYQEFEAVKSIEHNINLEAQKKFYQEVGMPKYYGMFELGCLIRKVNAATTTFGLAWFEQICKYSSRDQLSFPFVKWLMGDKINIKTMQGNCSQYLGTPFENEGNKYFINHSNHLK